MWKILTSPQKYSLCLFLVLSVLVLIPGSLWYAYHFYQNTKPIRIGVIYSLTGSMAVRERPIVAGIYLAVKEINERGGIFGRHLQIVLADGESDEKVFAAQAERLITREQVSVLFACRTSQSRKAVKKVVEKYRHLLFYPEQSEGLEQSENIIYTGSAPNQLMIPGTRWALENLGKRVYLFGSDTAFSHVANLLIADLIHADQSRILGTRYLPLDSNDVAAVITEINHLKPDVIINTNTSNSVVPFYKSLQASPAKNTPVLSFTVSENAIANFPVLATGNHYVSWSYFQSIDNPRNREFVKNYHAMVLELVKTGELKLPPDAVLPVSSAPVEAAYVSVYLWSQAAVEAQSVEPEAVNPAVLRQSFNAPSGIISMDKATRHIWKMFRIGKIQASGQFKELENSSFSLRPEPYPGFRSRTEWLKMLHSLPKEQP
jgi:urea transport system substrate-binding protein